MAPVLALGFMAFGGTGRARADAIYAFSSGSRSASANFSLVNPTTLRITLTNTSSADTLVPTDVLTALYFHLAGAPTLGKVSAVIAAGSTVFYDSDGQPAGGVVGGEWAYKSGIDVEVGDHHHERKYNEGISSTGLGIFGSSNRFPGLNLAGPSSPGGVEYGLVTAGDDSATGNGGIKGSGGLIKNSAIFTLQVANGFSLSQLGETVGFQYGTDLCEPSFNGCLVPGPDFGPAAVPEPSSLLLAAIGVGGAFGYRTSRSRRAA
ncbi:MAG: PEP-CTERM sorting domain-containing protein [Isosphaeraceae bacterium]